MSTVTAELMLQGLPVNHITATHRYHAGLFILTHKKTGKLFICAGSNIYILMRSCYSLLRNNKHQCRALQEAYNDDPEFSELATLTGMPERSHELKQQLLDKYYKTKMLLNIMPVVVAPNSVVTQELRDKIRGSAELCVKPRKVYNDHKPSIMIEGVVYRSMQDAADKLGILMQTVYRRIKSAKFPEWKRIIYQQDIDPSKVIYM